ncbi:MAG: Ig-like domain repeat protein [Acidimicrobiaceae bacterium]|nr:Ig-like domain repeat protein [Acidimicrobiaceae bacterium]
MHACVPLRRAMVDILVVAVLLGILVPLSADRAQATGPATPTVLVSSSSAAPVIGQSVTFTAAVEGATPTGSVAFLEGGLVLCSSVSLGGGGSVVSASCTVPNIALVRSKLGSTVIVALYSGDGANLPAEGATQIDLLGATTATSLSSSATTVAPGQSVTYTATVSSGAGTPSGSVVFTDAGVAISSCGGSFGASLTSGSATCTVSSGYASGSTHLVTATYLGSTLFAASGSPVLVEAVTPAPSTASTSTALASSASTVIADRPLTLTATVSSSSAASQALSGTVTFTENGAAISGCQNLSLSSLSGAASGVVSCSLPSGFSAAGTVRLDALYLGNSASTSFPSAASPLALQVSPITSTLSLSASPDPAPSTSPITLTATVTGAANPSGAVQFAGASGPLSCAVDLGDPGLVAVSNGSATCTLSGLAIGLDQVSASYLGGAALAESAAGLVETVEQAPAASAVVVTAGANPAANGSQASYTATVTSTGGTPSGSVNFVDGSTTLCAAIGLIGGSATCSPGPYPASGQQTQVIEADYSGSGDVVASSGQLTEHIGSGLTVPSMSLSSSGTSVEVGTSITYTATLQGFSGSPAGSVGFTDNGTTISSCGSLGLTAGSASTWSATCTVSGGYAADTSRQIVATYSGDGSNASASSELVQQISPAPAGVQLQVSPSPTGVGTTVDLSASLTGSFGQPGGSVSFTVDGQPAGCGGGGQVAVAAGVADCVLPAFPSQGAHVVAADYSGSSTYLPAGASAVEQVNATGASVATMSLAVGTQPVSAGSDLTYEVQVNGSGAAPGGTVSVTDDGATLASCTDLALSGGQASCTAAADAAVGVHQLKASYSGDPLYASSAVLVPLQVRAAEATPAPGSTSSSGSGTGSGSGSGPPSGVTTDGGGSSPSTPSLSPTSLAAPTAPTPTPATTITVPVPSPKPGSAGKPALAHVFSAPLAGSVGERLVYRVHLGGAKGAAGGTVSFTVGRQTVPGCTGVRLTATGTVTCTLVHGFTSAGTRLVGVRYSGTRTYRAWSTSLVERVTPTWHGFWTGSSDLAVRAYGGARAYPARAARLSSTRAAAGSLVAVVATPDDLGYWSLTSSGTLLASGDARTYGAGPPAPAAPYVGLAASLDGRGYWVLSRSGEVFAFGDARRIAPRRNPGISPAVAIAASPDGRGLWVLGRSGEVLALGDASHVASTTKLADAVALAPTLDGHGYWLLARDGAVVAVGDARHFAGVLPSASAGPFTSIATTGDAGGYWLLARDGAVYAFGNARSAVHPLPVRRHGEVVVSITGT